MNNNTNSITECLNQMIALTQQNLAIMKTINEAFVTHRNHLAVNVDDQTFVIPSFISLESRIESLEANLENLVNAPLTGEVFTYYDGTTQKMELSGYSTTPNHVELNPISRFGVNPNSIFKDFMSPNPYIRLDISSIPNNIKHVNVRKVDILNDNLVAALNNISTGSIAFADVERLLYGYTEGIDYEMYDTVRRLPIRSGVAFGEYEIKSIIDNYQDANFDEFYELELNKDLVYHVNNGTIQKDMKVGDTLVTYNDKVMMEVVELNRIRKSIKVKILHGAYSDLQDSTSGNPVLYKLKYYKSDADLSASKYIDVPLEEDRYVLVFVAPINDTTNTQAPWGSGIWMDVDTLEMPDPNDPSETISFRTYYDKYVNNVGDALYGITSMMDDDEQVSRLSRTQFEAIRGLIPIINGDFVRVTQINKHLNDSKSIKTIRNLYAQKNQYKAELDTVQRNIEQVTKKLSELSFDATTNSRTAYEAQLTDYNNKRAELINSINSIIQEISLNANNSEVPIENAKYHIRGFIPTNLQGIDTSVPDFVKAIKIDVEYRYKNPSSFVGNAETYPGEDQNTNYIFSDWNKMDSIYRVRTASYQDGRYVYSWEADNADTNNPSYNQIDIPISQGEIVDIRVRYIYNVGYPFAEVRSAWSDIYIQSFPSEFTKDVDVLDIISENNDDIKNKYLEGLLDRKGVTAHIDDEFMDQTVQYRHHATSISSGFFTPERRVIPLSDKLASFNTDMEALKAEVYGASSSNLIVTLGDINNTIQLKPNIINSFHTTSYKNAVDNGSTFPIYDSNRNSKAVAISQLVINIYNNGSYVTKLHSLFPGAYDTELSDGATSQFNVLEYISQAGRNDHDVYMMLDQPDQNTGKLYTNQHYNQFLYFRSKLTDMSPTGGFDGYLYRAMNDASGLVGANDDKYDNGCPKAQMWGAPGNVIEMMDATNMNTLYNRMSGTDNRMGAIYPYPGVLSCICIPSGESFISIEPGESVNIPLNFVYWFEAPMANSVTIRAMTVSRMMAFDIRTSLFRDPITFKFIVDAAYEDVKGFEIKQSTGLITGLSPLNSTIAAVGLNKTMVDSQVTPSTTYSKAK